MRNIENQKVPLIPVLYILGQESYSSGSPPSIR